MIDDSYTKSLLHMNGADASTTFADENSSHTWTANGNAQIDTAQYKFGGASGLFDGTGDYISGDGSADFAFGTGDLTIDFWFRLNAINAVYSLFDFRPSGVASGAYPHLYVFSDNKLYYYVSGNNQITGTTVLSGGGWYHAAIVRSGTSTKLFLGGVQEGSTYVDNTNYLIGTSRPTIGANGNSAGVQSLDGWIDEFRVSKGIARWTANFTPPTQEYGVTGNFFMVF